MTLEDSYNFLNFWIDKTTGAFYSPKELDLVTDRGQMSMFADLSSKYATSQRIKDALSPFRTKYDFLAANTPAGLLTVPSNLNYLKGLDIYINYLDGATNRYRSVPIVNEDERTDRVASQIDAPTTTAPIAEMVGKGIFQFWPKIPFAGSISFLRRPVAPVFNYTTISGRVIVYNPFTSVQLEWPEDWQNAVLIKALSSIGTNLSSGEISQFAESKSSQNAQNNNRT